ncbi:glycoside hydrolase family 19 protein [Cronobacter sakazakii]
MKISYPIRDTDGQAFRSCGDVMRLVDDEPHGTWLLGTNTLWHGGIHISEVSNPFSALNPDAKNTGEPVPLQFMADGTVVAYRLNSAYLTAPYGGKPLRYSSSFVLVKSVCQPDSQKEKSWLGFYCLYMHLAAVADYPLSPCYKVREGHSGIRLRKYTPGQNGLPEGAAENGAAGDYAAPAKTKRSLKAGDRFVVSRTGRFYLTTKGKATLTTFGLARLLNGDVPGAEQYWVTLDAALTEPDGDMQLLMPAWMRRAAEKGVYDEVVLTEEADDWTVSAGTPVGFMGCTESPSENSTDVDKEWYVHLEVLSTDSRMPAFLINPEGVDGEKRWLLVPNGKTLYVRQDSEDGPVFTATTARVSAQSLLSREAATPVADASKTWWYNITGEGWLPQSDVEEINQYDLMRQGFQPLEETGGGDVMQSPYESWVPEAFGEISRSAEQGTAHQYSQVPAFYGDLMTEMDGNRDGKVTAEEVRQALTVRAPLVKAVVNRLVVKHHSEWCKGRSTGRWEGFYRELDPFELNYCEKWQADLEWMSKVPPFDKDEAVWHFHPVVFLDSLKSFHEGVTFDQLKIIFPDASDEDINVVVEELAGKLEIFKLDTPTRLRHFFSQIRGEVGSGMKGKTESFQFSPSTLRAFSSYYRANVAESETDGYQKNLNNKIIRPADEQAIGRKHYLRLNGNRQTNPDDGYNFRGRGLIQITGYEKYNGFFEDYNTYWAGDAPDVINSPGMINDMPYAIRSAIWFWIKYKPYIADSGKGYDDVAGVTRMVNGGTMGLAERRDAYKLCEKVFL